MADAVRAGQLGPEADANEAVYLVSTLITGVLSQAIANAPDLERRQGRLRRVYTAVRPRLQAQSC